MLRRKPKKIYVPKVYAPKPNPKGSNSTIPSANDNKAASNLPSPPVPTVAVDRANPPKPVSQSTSSLVTAELKTALKQSHLSANPGRETLGSIGSLLIRVPKHLRAPYDNAFAQMVKHPMFQVTKKNIRTESNPNYPDCAPKVLVNWENKEIQGYIKHIGKISSNDAFLMEPNAVVRELAKQVYITLFNANAGYKDQYTSGKVHERLKCFSIIDVSIKGKPFTFASVAGSAGRNDFATTQLHDYLEENAEWHQLTVLPPVSYAFKTFYLALADELGLPRTPDNRVCSELSCVVNLAKLFYEYGLDLQINGIATVPILVAHEKNPDQNDWRSPEQRLSTYDLKTGIASEPIDEYEEDRVHFWYGCHNCRDKKSLYLILLGVMQNLSLQNRNQSSSTQTPVQQAKGLFSPLAPNVEQGIKDELKVNNNLSSSTSSNTPVVTESKKTNNQASEEKQASVVTGSSQQMASSCRVDALATNKNTFSWVGLYKKQQPQLITVGGPSGSKNTRGLDGKGQVLKTVKK